MNLPVMNSFVDRFDKRDKNIYRRYAYNSKRIATCYKYENEC